jgi:hypothetical protein
MAKVPKFKDKDIPSGLTTLIQALVVQLIQSKALTVEQGRDGF